MKKTLIVIFLSLFVLSPGMALAHGEEHKEHAGHEEMQGEAHEMHEEEAATLREAAAILKASHPDLAAQLEKMAKEHEAAS